MAASPPLILTQAEEYVRCELQGIDASHDFEHIDRVRKLALSLAAEENVLDSDTLQVIELAALLHDIKDWKYSGSESAGSEAARTFLLERGVAPVQVDRIVHVYVTLSNLLRTLTNFIEMTYKMRSPQNHLHWL